MFVMLRPCKRGTIVGETCFSFFSFPSCAHERFVDEEFFDSENQKHVTDFLIETFCLRKETMFTRLEGLKRAALTTLSMCKYLGPILSLFVSIVWTARKNCFPIVCAPQKHVGKQCFRNIVFLVCREL